MPASVEEQPSSGLTARLAQSRLRARTPTVKGRTQLFRRLLLIDFSSGPSGRWHWSLSAGDDYDNEE
jgi:hypothetical protein